ncbi:alpha-hydroxy acid oxidase [Streptomyces prunicolor]|uniref:Alpha-hydroxy acid oxidase n=1 Tax=Streptomyces prunicolor TaxID=67348 RepID=A0ABU4FT17_9ACTN|nr:alpha-hydroxy acid oxidase [Streptomyces prunicolor]MCX5243626.1 alpha-hydroxy-acid oxidizing protein [Streptomyces prunicolor]MDV7223707.1 alpha-hydroxy acid oxidase [Streptomyces prunicolor]
MDDLGALAAEVLSAEVWDFISGGSGSERTLDANRTALDRVAVSTRVLTGIQQSSTAAKLVRTAAALPLAVAPMAYQRLLHPEGEVAAARAAAAAGVPFAVSTISSLPIEEIAEAGAALWFQLYWLRDRGRVVDLVQRAEQAGCEALMVTVDVPVMARRLRDLRNEFTLPAWIDAAHLESDDRTGAHVTAEHGSAVAEHTRSAFDPTLSWADLDWLREQTRLPVVVKGVLDPRDAVRAARAGAEAVVVSNHGGRQLDGVLPSITALTGVVEAVDGQCQVLMDSGIRSGVDILRALALGADGVLVGRPVLWGLAAGGTDGVGQVFALLRSELEEALLLAGCPDVTAVRALLRTGVSATAADG